MTRARRLPGFRFEVQPPPRPDLLPRMDVAVFVGFTASGPLHRPVPIEDVAEFDMIFGDDVRLAWDPARGEPVYAYLAPAVRAFFRNGGRRCWIIRVAGQAQSNAFPVPCLAQAQFDKQAQFSALQPAFARARSAGSWADAIRVSTALLNRSLPIEIVSLAQLTFDVPAPSAHDIRVGDLIRLAFDGDTGLLFAVKSIDELEPITSPPAPGFSRITGDKAIWTQPAWAHPPAVNVGLAYTFTPTGLSAPIAASVPFKIESGPLELDWPATSKTPAIKIDLALSFAAAPLPGSLLRVDFGVDQFWLMVQDVRAADDAASPPSAGVQVSGEGVWLLKTAPSPASPPRAERLTFELRTRTGSTDAMHLSDLAFDGRHARCWAALPTDEQLFSDINAGPRSEYVELYQAAADPRFPLAGDEAKNVLYFPIAMPILPDYELPPAVAQTESALKRDGLEVFDASLFLDPDLAEVGVRDLINEADFIRYQSTAPRALQGLHAALSIDEATLIAVPDAVQRGWTFKPIDPSRLPPPSDPILRPEWWHYLECDSSASIKPVREPDWGNFLNCDLRSNLIPPPRLEYDAPDAAGTFTLSWFMSPPLSDIQHYVLQEALRADFKDAVDIYAGPDEQRTLYGHTPGTYYYRVRAGRDRFTSDWSDGVVVDIEPPGRWLLTEASAYSNETLLTIQHAVLRLCAARGDLFAVLALPEHYREDDTISHSQALTTGRADFFGPEEARTLSFGALYHPWPIGREENRPAEFRRTPPDGAACGLIAQRTIGRGAWIAPANEALKGVVALTPVLAQARWLDLQDARLNTIYQTPRGFMPMNANTLTADEDWQLINVRRLLMLLRRLAVRLGATYVFEPHSEAFQRVVQRGFEAVLDEMFVRGAFAGSTANSAYQVVTDRSVNPPPLIDQGRFVVELRVAPSHPMSFLTVRLVQTGDRTLVTQEQ